ncbi:TPA: helix-turn-helix domain-containing protein [Vibrio parahaemolyticus]|uniref:Resolvase HTH domain-containing protein n=1 Tax=Vibrio furnissii TaxID=29494 RepID=A0A0Q2QZP4_VIBFU|nr:helix-turn-helix domain-containing protein [Vibrio parahaemolyticus]KQH85389.1 hypothetical protein AMR76_12835 [Vibrio furnissii]AWA88764.1 hypothetical protein BSG32_06775 [Vibrio parahaemolyticus]EII5811712.1 helix-turn-helix domain-containing protein [Vibrio parahaemolyticus]EIZ1343072.1 helix-turn-helix domain-containing protein [Vibrio parahaemolyticus]EJU9699599.1 helix-turn-helix domain-containing protein [Vibrio parahaemolyticus]
MFGFGIQKTINRGVFQQMHRRDQDQFLQYIYDAGYSVKEIAREYGLSPQTIYSRINAHRGRGPLQT